MFTAQLEFAVQMACESCADKVRTALESKPGKKSSKGLTELYEIAQIRVYVLHVQQFLLFTNSSSLLKCVRADDLIASDRRL